jgi:uncharacterized protein
MAVTNRERLLKGFDLLVAGLGPYAVRECKAKLGSSWEAEVGYKMPRTSDVAEALTRDPYALLKAMIDQWHGVFKDTLGHMERSIVGELLTFRNRFAHGDSAFSSEDTLRALDSMQRLLTSVSAREQSEEVGRQRFDLQRQVFDEQARQHVRQKTTNVGSATLSGLRPWREIVTPHRDVASGRYAQSEFAADLAQVQAGTAGPEYGDPVEFFRRTYITAGMHDLLIGALQRMSGDGGDPVVELQTNFGGGKTHAMLALYHIFGGIQGTELPGLEPVLKAAGVEKVTKAKRVVLVGTALSPAQVTKKPDGTEVRTLWGELAWQLGGAQGYLLVAESDRKGTSPGSQVLANLFRLHGPALVLIDEWVAYARQLVDKTDLPAGSFEAQDSFAQALTEAAKAADKTLIVASIPASKVEIGGKAGDHAVAVLKNVFERVAKPWRPASADEGFEIVRRRLFEPITEKLYFAARDAVVDSFSRMYRDDAGDYPAGCGEAEYKAKMVAAYPIHPELFQRLYEDWSTLDKFQRTRGVLRLLATVIRRLWETQDTGLFILPSAIPLDDPSVRSEITRYLDDVWEPIISQDVDGPNSLPLRLDSDNPNLGRISACRRAARALYMGTAPGSTGKNPGIDDRGIRLGCTQPGETAAIFTDALRRISDKAKHIHQDGNRYWVSTKANLNRLAEDRANTMKREAESLHAEVVRRVREEHKVAAARGDFAGVHPCPDNTSEVDDDPVARLVIIGPEHVHRKAQMDSPAMRFARALLEQRGNSPRLCRNTLVFLAPDAQRLDELLDAVAHYLSWKGIQDSYEDLNLDVTQQRQAASKVRDFDDTVAARIRETWTLALVPSHRDAVAGEQVKPEEMIAWEDIRIGGADALAKRTAAKLKNDGSLITALGGLTLRHHLDAKLWKERSHVQVGQLAEWFARYLYLPRVVNRDVLYEAIRDGMGQLVPDDTFAMAASFDAMTGRYAGLKLQGAGVIENTSLLVKTTVAKAQIEEDRKEKCPSCHTPEPTWDPVEKKCASCGHEIPKEREPQCPTCKALEPEWNPVERTCRACGYKEETPVPRCPSCDATAPVWDDANRTCRTCDAPKKPNLFVGSVTLDGGRLGRDAGRVAEEVLQHLSTLSGASVEVRLEVQVRVPAGVPDDTVRTVSENARTLKFDAAGFERE